VDPLFPELPEDLASLSDEDLSNLLREHEVAAKLIDEEDAEFIGDMEAEDVLTQYETGVEQIEALLAEQQARAEAHETYQQRKLALAERRKASFADEDPGDETDAEASEEEEAEEEEGAELSAEAEEEGDEEGDGEGEGNGEEASADPELAPVVAAAAVTPKAKPALRRMPPPAPTKDRQVQELAPATLVAAGGLEDVRAGKVLDRMSLASVMKITAIRKGPPIKSKSGVEEKFRVASAHYNFPEDRILDPTDWSVNSDKIARVIPAGVPGLNGLVASGGLCAPLTPIYSMPNYASQARPVRDALPSFQADRGGVNVPEATIIGDITSAISLISEEEDALGGTFATKSCQDLECAAYTEVPVSIIAHCREYGNLNARAWPEKIAHENDLTMAAHARTAETFLLDRIKALSVNVTNGAETLGALIYMVDGIVKAGFGIRTRLRMDSEAVLRVLLPDILPYLLQLDTVQTQFDRFRSRDQLVAYLRSFNLVPSFYMDSPSTGTSQIADASQTEAAIDPLPDTLQWAIFPEGAFIHVDGGSLELGLVRDSTLNSTNDFQIFGETFENVARIAPAQAAYWVTSDLCASGQFPPAGTARTCD
jgi:hypothetical protein